MYSCEAGTHQNSHTDCTGRTSHTSVILCFLIGTWHAFVDVQAAAIQLSMIIIPYPVYCIIKLCKILENSY